MFGAEYRPLDFSSVLGLTYTKEIFQKILRTKLFDPGYLLSGPHSTGKTSLARIFARSVFCTSPKEDMSPCNVCQSCKDFLAGRHPAYLEVDAANNSTKERIQEIKDSLSYEGSHSHRIVLFDEAHSISKEGKDALLSHLERLDTRTILIFCTTEPEKMPSTISSRCMQFQIHEPPEKNVIDKLEMICKVKGFAYTREALFMIMQDTGRHYRDAENKLRMVSLLGDISVDNAKKVCSVFVDDVVQILTTIAYDLSAAMNTANNLVASTNIKTIYEGILKAIKDAIMYGLGVTWESEHYNELMKQLHKQHGNGLYEMLDYILSKNRLNDLTMFQSDLLVLHYRLLRGSFAHKEFEAPKKELVTDPKKETEKSTDSSAEIIKSSEKMTPWNRDEVVRDLKMKKIMDGEDDRVHEKVSDSWGPETKEGTTAIPRMGISRKELKQIFGGTSNGAKI